MKERGIKLFIINDQKEDAEKVKNSFNALGSILKEINNGKRKFKYVAFERLDNLKDIKFDVNPEIYPSDKGFTIKAITEYLEDKLRYSLNQSSSTTNNIKIVIVDTLLINERESENQVLDLYREELKNLTSIKVVEKTLKRDSVYVILHSSKPELITRIIDQRVFRHLSPDKKKRLAFSENIDGYLLDGSLNMGKIINRFFDLERAKRKEHEKEGNE